MQDGAFTGRVRVIASTRSFHFSEKLNSLTTLVARAVPVEVDLYDLPELDAKLALENIERDKLHPDLVPLARLPRLFALVVKFRERLVEAGAITTNRLLWEYGKDTLGCQNGRAFSEREWREWLHLLAKRVLSDGASFTYRDLAESAASRDLAPRDVFSRISDLVDGSFVAAKPSGFEATSVIVSHALGLALLGHLDEIAPGDQQTALDKWLDAIAGLDERAEILRAAVSIMVARSALMPCYATAVLAAWLQTQNIPAAHQLDLVGLAEPLVDEILSAIPLFTYAQAAARQSAVKAIRSLRHDNADHCRRVVEKAAEWLRHVPRGVERNETSKEAEARRTRKFVSRIGVDRSGPVTVFGVPLILIDHTALAATETIPARLQWSALSCRIEQDHRRIKCRVRSMLSFKSTTTAEIILSGIEMVHMMRKRQARFAYDPTPSIAKQFEILAA